MSNLVQRLATLDTPTVSDALDKLSLAGCVTGLRPMTVRRRIAGQVVTLALGPCDDGGPPKRHLGAGAVMAGHPGDVIVVEHQSVEVSGWGGLLSRGATLRGISGVIIDGAFRDVDEAVELDFPIYARAAVPLTARGRIAEKSFNAPIVVGGCQVSPGDMVIADSSGVVFLLQAHAEAIISLAEDLYSREERMARELQAGVAIEQVLDARYEEMLKRGATDGE